MGKSAYLHQRDGRAEKASGEECLEEEKSSLSRESHESSQVKSLKSQVRVRKYFKNKFESRYIHVHVRLCHVTRMFLHHHMVSDTECL